ncbi:MAG: D-glycero-beta-D-manno-heptose 1-phosphate adenylyltransferase [Candidatus Kapaibacteriota bacterium]|jgi:D-beta-D-heptose 7-phosphate kinase/D-beta-D-heptose 1-phosphate adenosyltransferase
MIVDFNEIGKICEQLHCQGKKIVFTNGCFDLLHIGHVKYLAEAKNLGDVLVVGLNSDDSVRRLKGDNRPLTPQKERAEILDALKPIDFVVIFDDDTPLELIKIVKPDVLAKGGDYKPEDIVGADFVKNCGGNVVVIPFVEGKSTTSIIEKIKKM